MSIPPLLTSLADVCRAPAAEMEANGLHDGNWHVSHARTADEFVEFTSRDRKVCITYVGDTMYPALRWHVMDDKARVGGSGATLAVAVAGAKANGWPL